MSRPRLLLVPTINALEWPILPLLEEWADVAVVEGPWVEDGLALRRAVEELDARGWPSAVLLSDEWSIFKALEILEGRPDLVSAFAFGHACTQLTRQGARPSLSPGVADAYMMLLRTDFRMYARALTQTTRGDYDDALVARFLESVSLEDALANFERILAREGETFLPVLESLEVPLLLARHTECLLWTEEGFHDAEAALPQARTVEVAHKPSASPEYAAALRDFCTSL